MRRREGDRREEKEAILGMTWAREEEVEEDVEVEERGTEVKRLVKQRTVKWK